MAKIKITSESTVDLSPDLIERYDIGVIPLFVTLDERTAFDGEDLFPSDIYEFAEKTGKLPKTAARSSEDLKNFFEGIFAQGYTDIIHCSISTHLSASYQSAVNAAAELRGVTVIDVPALSSGTGLIAVYAAELAASGMLAAEIVSKARARLPHIQTSFIIDSMEYLYKGGRCSSMQLVAGKVLRIKPVLNLIEGKIEVGRKFMGQIDGSVLKYVDDTMEKFSTPDLSRLFITYTTMSDQTLEAVRERVLSKFKFKEVYYNVAGATITSHCGKGTLGIIYMNDGEA
ncbi:MAG: DegV family protein [Firmicutes bacterium]|nr:DegV family protein [Bacillota bacterium]